MFDAFDELGVDTATLAAEFAAQGPMERWELLEEVAWLRGLGLDKWAIARRLDRPVSTVKAWMRELELRETAASAEIETLP